MAAFCSCLQVDYSDHIGNQASSAFRNCMCLRCFTQQLINAYTVLFRVGAVHPVDSTESSFDTYRSPPRTLPYDDPRFSPPSRDWFALRRETSSHSLDESEPLWPNDDEEMERSSPMDRPSKTNYDTKMKRCSSTYREKLPPKELGNYFTYFSQSAEDEDVCPTCLEEDVNERREAIAVLLDLSNIPQVRPRIGRIKGCIVMLVTLRNANESGTNDDAEKLLHILSSNPQNVLLMAEAGYFRPLIHYLKEGSDMNKVLMATAISKMFLSEQMKSSLGEDGAVEPLVEMFKYGNLEAKHSALGALRNLSSSLQNAELLINSGITGPLLQLLFSVTSVLMTLREPASAILAAIAQSERILLHKDVGPQMLSLLNLSSPVIQLHLLRALNSISGHTNAKRARSKIRKNGGVQLLLPFLTEKNVDIKIAALNLMFHLSKDSSEELAEQFRETHLDILVKIVSSPTSRDEKAAAVGILSNLPVTDKKITEILTQANLVPILISLFEANITASLTPQRMWLLEGIAGVFIRFTVTWDKKLQSLAVGYGVVPCLIKLLSEGSVDAKSKAATSLAQLSQSSMALRKSKLPRWLCVPPSAESYCIVHNCQCTVKSTFCLVKAGAVNPLVRILEGEEREADGAVLEALATLMQDEIWENGSRVIEKASGIHALLRVAEAGDLSSQDKAIWMLERIFRLESHRERYGEIAQALLIDLAQKGNPVLKPMIGKILAHLELLQTQSSYF